MAAVEALKKQYTEVGDRLEQEQGTVMQLRWGEPRRIPLLLHTPLAA